MIVPNLKGGLCNQLFQIATAHAHAKRCSTFCGINYTLKHGCIQGHPPIKYKDNLYKNILVTDGEPSEKYSDPKFEYTPIPKKKDLLIDGYFQSEKYFAEFKDEIKNLFTFPADIVQKIDNKFTDIPKKKIGVHIRRGDYKMFPTTHPTQTTEYYDRALRHFSLKQAEENCVFILCTDDFSSVQAEFDLNKYGFIYSNAKSELEDLYILSQCDSVIMSNSSFAWWGAWLGKDKEEVICPLIWFGPDGPRDVEDIVPEQWIRL